MEMAFTFPNNLVKSPKPMNSDQSFAAPNNIVIKTRLGPTSHLIFHFGAFSGFQTSLFRPTDETRVLLFTNIPNAAGVSPTTFRWMPWTPFVFLNDKDVDGNVQ